ncbi:MAG: SpoIID/LytB domain-containing protein [Phycisphaerae bacterium]
MTESTDVTISLAPGHGALDQSGGIGSPVSVMIRMSGGEPIAASLPLVLSVERGGDASDLPTMTIASARAGGDWGASRTYPGDLFIGVSDGGKLEVINHVDLERYVGIVVAHELLPSFHEVSFRAGAIVARTFAICEMRRMNRGRFDVRATQGSQVYGGLTKDKDLGAGGAAARQTRGLVCTWTDAGGHRDVFTTFYSSVCGGVSRGASSHGGQAAIPPLRGGVACDFCRIAPSSAYRWGPLELPFSELDARLLRRRGGHGDQPLTGIEILNASALGRVETIRVSRGDKEEIWPAEQFRLAVGSMDMRSTLFTLRQDEESLIFSDGRGFGHGLGLCQWGMEGQARQGQDAGAILRYYYPGSELTRVY